MNSPTGRYLDQLTAAALLRQLLVVADLAPRLTDAELTHRLVKLAGLVR